MINTDHYWPRGDEHAAVVGRNGTGKTILGFFLLSLRDFRKTKTIITDYKREEVFKLVKNIREIGPGEKLPRENGLYIVRPLPEIDDDPINDMLWRILERGNTGLFVDEGYMLPNDGKSRPFKAILTQGRAKRIPVITLSQRPVGVTPFAFTEASHIASFDLNDRDDRKVIERRAGSDFFDGVEDLPDYHSRWCCIKRKNARYVIAPAPPAEDIAASIDAQLKPVRTWF